MCESFKLQKTFAERKNESAKIIQKYTDKIPVICEKFEKSNMPNIDKTKYLVPNTLTIGQFMFIIRKRLKLNPKHALFLTINGNIHSSSSLMKDIFEECKDPDGFLYIKYCEENTFG